MELQKWTILGPRLVKARPSWAFLVLAFIFAAETFIDLGAGYPIYMSVLALAAGAWGFYSGVRARALLSLLFLPVSLIWLNPLVGGTWFGQLDVIFFVSHAAMAMLLGIASYSFLAAEAPKK